jgi:glycerophosphoryl diester phosphodiesterase
MANRLILLGHRGARANKAVPENTVASFDQALADGCDGFEFDVRLTADGEAVICHDAKLGGKKVEWLEAKELSQLPRLQNVLSRYRDSFLDIELKVKGLERITADLFLRHKPRRGFVVSSFVPGILKGVQAQDKSIPVGLICETQTQLKLWTELSLAYVIPQHDLVDVDLIRKIKGAGKKIMVWTVNAAVDMQRFAEWGVDGIISDDTKLLCETLAPRTEASE